MELGDLDAVVAKRQLFSIENQGASQCTGEQRIGDRDVGAVVEEDILGLEPCDASAALPTNGSGVDLQVFQGATAHGAGAIDIHGRVA